MARFFGRKRAHKPNKNLQKVKRGLVAERGAATLNEIYPMLKRLRIEVTFMSQNAMVIDQKTLKFEPKDACNLSVNCPGRCGMYVFNFDETVQEMTNNGEGKWEGETTCQERTYAGIPEPCGCRVRASIAAEY